MKNRMIIFSFIFLLIISCDKESNNLFNCQDPNNDCYLNPIQNMIIKSYSPSEIVILGSNLNDFEMIRVDKTINNEIDTIFVIEKNEANNFIDSIEIELNNIYDYSVRNYSNYGVSDAVTDLSINHTFPSVLNDSLKLKARNEVSVDIDWHYDLNEIFYKEYDDINWKIIRYKQS